MTDTLLTVLVLVLVFAALAKGLMVNDYDFE